MHSEDQNPELEPEIVEAILEEEQSTTEEAKIDTADRVLPDTLIILPLQQRPVFPGLTIPLSFSGNENLELIQEVVSKRNGLVGLVLAQEYNEVNPAEGKLHEVGTTFRILRVVPAGEDSIQVLGEGVSRFEKKKVAQKEPFQVWEVAHRPDKKPEEIDAELKAYMMALSSEIRNLLKINELMREQVNMIISQLNYSRPGLTMDLISNMLSAEPEQLQQLIEEFRLTERAKLLLLLVKKEVEVAKIKSKINQSINEKVNKQQKEFFLRQQLSEIKKELGIEKDGTESEVDKLRERLEKRDLPEEVKRATDRELEKLATLNAQSPEFNVTRSYLDLIADLPWGEYSEDNHDIKKARQILDQDHYGLKDVKDAILEFLSSVIKRGKIAGSIICLVGPPGVGKTSIGKSVAEALGRKFFRFSVGGMRDEAEIKGHRRTYIGAMPGKLIQALKRVETSNPVIMLDEIDKIGSSYQGDPASALLEVLDPEQNDKFLDHYLDLPYDLSNVLFITTANQLETIPGPLRDRMEIIRIAGYTQREKVQIGKQYLVPKQLIDHGYQPDEITFTDEAMALIVDRYAREAGVRNFEKQIRKIVRKTTLQEAEGEEIDREIEADEVEGFLGQPIFRTEKLYDGPVVGVVLGLAYTTMGGATLYIEANGIRSDRPGFKYTGQLGDVMKESAQIAYSYVRSLLADSKETYREYFDQHLVHLHVPAGSTPKDGPSAGITMALALYSLATGRPIRDGLAMTGELTLTGKVLPIGGVKEKTLGARRVGIETLIFPEDNRRDFEELPEHIKEGIEVHFADYFADVLRVAGLDTAPKTKARRSRKSTSKSSAKTAKKN